MSKGSKFAMDMSNSAIAETAAQMSRKLSPTAGFDTAFVEAARGIERSRNPFAGSETGTLRAAMAVGLQRSLDPTGLGRLHRSMAEHATTMMGGEACRSHVAAMNAIRPVSDAMSASKAWIASSQISGLNRALAAKVGLNGLDDLRRGVTGILGEGPALASLDAFTNVRDRLGVLLGLEAARQWDRVAAAAALPSLAALTFSFERPTAVMTIARADDVLGTLAWLEAPLDEDDPPRVVVAALHSRKPEGPIPWRELRIASGAAINCRNCGEPFDLKLQLWLTSEDPDPEVFFQGEMLPTCGACEGYDNSLAEVPPVAPYRLIDGGGEGDEKAVGKLTLVVDNVADDNEG